MTIPEKNYKFRYRQEINVRMSTFGESCMDDTDITLSNTEIFGPYKTECPSEDGCYEVPMQRTIQEAVDIEYVMCMDIWHGYPLYACGDNLECQLGNNADGEYKDIFIPIGEDITVEWLYPAGGGDSSFAKDYQTNTWYSWGNNTYGQLGLGTTVPQYVVPTLILSANMELVVPYAPYTFRNKQGSYITGWRGGNYPALLLNALSASEAVDVSADVCRGFHLHEIQGWRHVRGTLWESGPSAGISHDGTLWTQGVFSITGVTSYNTYATRIGTDTDWIEIVCVCDSVLAVVKVDGTLWYLGDLGLGNEVSVMTQCHFDNDWLGVQLHGDVDGCWAAIKRDGSIWGWGSVNNTSKSFAFPTQEFLDADFPNNTPTKWYEDSEIKEAYLNVFNGSYQEGIAIFQDGYIYQWGNYRSGNEIVQGSHTGGGFLTKVDCIGDGWSFWNKSHGTVLIQGSDYWVLRGPYESGEVYGHVDYSQSSYDEGVLLYRLKLPENINTTDVLSILCGTGDCDHLLLENGTLYVKGNNAVAESGCGYQGDWVIADYEDLGNVECIATGISHSYAVSHGKVYSCGSDLNGEAGDGVLTGSVFFTKIATSFDNASKVFAGDRFGMAVTSDQLLFATGLNTSGQLGLGDIVERTSFTEVTGKLADTVSCGYDHTLLITGDGVLHSAGDNTTRQLGRDVDVDYPADEFHSMVTYTGPKPIDPYRIAKFSVLDDGTVAYFPSGTLLNQEVIYFPDGEECIHINEDTFITDAGHIWVPHELITSVPNTDSTWVDDIRLDRYNTAGDNAIVRVGRNATEQYVDAKVFTYTPIGYGYAFVGIIAINTSGQCWIFKNNDVFYFSDTAVTQTDGEWYREPLNRSDWDKLFAINLTAPERVSLDLVTTSGALYHWTTTGSMEPGLETLHNNSNRLTYPQSIASNIDQVWVSYGGGNRAYLDTSGDIWANDDMYDFMGYQAGTYNDMAKTSIGNVDTLCAPMDGYNFAYVTDAGKIVITTDNFKAYTPPDTDFDNYPDTRVYVSSFYDSPIYIIRFNLGGCIYSSSENPNPEDDIFIWTKLSIDFLDLGECWGRFSEVAAGDGWSAAIRMNGTLWTWGNNTYGQLGTGDYLQVDVPTQVGVIDYWDKVVVGDFHLMVTTTGGDLYVCGKNDKGQLGLGHTNACITLTKVDTPVGMNFKELSAGL